MPPGKRRLAALRAQSAPLSRGKRRRLPGADQVLDRGLQLGGVAAKIQPLMGLNCTMRIA